MSETPLTLSEDGAVELANDTPYGLGWYLFTPDAEQALGVADRIEAGMVFVDIVGVDAAQLPFGVNRSAAGTRKRPTMSRRRGRGPRLGREEIWSAIQ